MKIICMNGQVIENYDRNEAAMKPTKEWSVLTVIRPNPPAMAMVGVRPIEVITPSKQGFLARFSNIDPFQRGRLVKLSEVSAAICSKLGLPC